ncbi:hypothetical protein EBU95_21875, partial [bacterium]|nr:hypothetical protein [bacterium]
AASPVQNLNTNTNATIQGGLIEQIIQQLGGPGAVKGKGFDFPDGLQGAAKYFNIDPNVPTDVKRTLSGPLTIKDNIVTYLKNVMGYASGGLAEAVPEMTSLMQGLYGKKTDQKPTKDYGKIGLRSDGSTINATYFKGDKREGYVSAYKMRDYLYYVGLSKATQGYGPRLYDVVMEEATAKGAMLTSDRSSISGAAKKVWEYYFKNRGDVNEIDPKLYGKPETWPPPTDPAWILQSGYSKSPSLINDKNSVIRMGDSVNSGAMALQYFSRANGGRLGFETGGTVPALVSNGEAYVPPKVAKSIGYGKLNRMNQADRNGMGRFSEGGISVFKGPGTGTSDSIPTRLPVGSFI